MNKQNIVAITGMGMSELSRKFVKSPRELAVDSAVAAISDAGLSGADVDGMIIARSPILPSAELPLRLQLDLALKDLSFVAAIDASGTSFVQAIEVAAMAVESGRCSAVVCVFADAPLRPGTTSLQAFSRAMPISGVEGMESAAGLFGATGAFALYAAKYMSECSISLEHLHAYINASRMWASGDKHARMTSSLTFAEYLDSPFVVEPFRLLDCAFPVNGAFSVVVTGVDKFSNSAAHPAYIHAATQGHDGNFRISGHSFEEETGASIAARSLYAKAGISPKDVEAFEVYAPFSVLGLKQIEDYGFCGRGEAGNFVIEGNTSAGAALPMNTGGGQISGFYLQGATPVYEALVQIRNEAGKSQIVGDGPVVVTGMGARYEYHAALILSRSMRL
ncbi:thiolase family protein [Candidatus Nitrotoga sp. M5]|uniref:thiolase family protein n=1 Tax=Candidatus Nitrotoga sp. M5 TaxID=2890409 RepID=UPI001EF62236|nr:thiolase family protein [Candidatus Nitrotoga sp. M5]CAH1387939.1 Thiolase [Candidatus Nitrotoga sp. M5]